MSQVLFYPLFLCIALILTLVYIPRPQYKKYLIYAAATGGLGEMIIAIILNTLFNMGHYTRIGIFNIFGYNYLSPFVWTFLQMLFLYFLPVRRGFLSAYILGFVGISIGFGYMIENLGIFVFNPTFYRWISPIIYLTWWSGTAWFFRRTEGINRRTEKVP